MSSNYKSLNLSAELVTVSASAIDVLQLWPVDLEFAM